MCSGGNRLWIALVGVVVAMGVAGWFMWGRMGSDAALAGEIAKALAQASPVADPHDAQAHRASAERLAALEALGSVMVEPFLWGGHRAGRGYKPEDSNLTALNPLVFRQMYLSLFMFTGESTVEEADGYTVLHLPARFRNELDPGDYSYPFWHATKKWENYQRSTEVIMLIREGRVEAGFRSDQEDASRPANARTWDGQWHWTATDGQSMPRVTLFSNLLSADNPHTTELDAAYRKFEARAREQRCMDCHSPDNIAKGNPLFILNYPNQSLVARHKLVKELSDNEMPPANPEEGRPAGIGDEARRLELLELAQNFERVADSALQHEERSKRSAP